jgi:hypothetical protein
VRKKYRGYTLTLLVVVELLPTSTEKSFDWQRLSNEDRAHTRARQGSLKRSNEPIKWHKLNGGVFLRGLACMEHRNNFVVARNLATNVGDFVVPDARA